MVMISARRKRAINEDARPRGTLLPDQ